MHGLLRDIEGVYGHRGGESIKTCTHIPIQPRHGLALSTYSHTYILTSSITLLALQCLHRFCKGCAELAVRKFSAVETDSRSALRSRRKQAGGAECPLCRTNIASRRDL